MMLFITIFIHFINQQLKIQDELPDLYNIHMIAYTIYYNIIIAYNMYVDGQTLFFNIRIITRSVLLQQNV